MLLSDIDIRQLLSAGIIKVEPLQDNQIGQASIDLTLSDEFWRFSEKARGETQDLSVVGADYLTEKTTAPFIDLRPGDFVLGKTIERITLPPNIMGRLEGRSRYARMGLAVHSTSAIVQPGSSNRQVLEIMNLGPLTIRLRAGLRISQVVFEELKSGTSKPYAKFGEVARKQ